MCASVLRSPPEGLAVRGDTKEVAPWAGAQSISLRRSDLHARHVNERVSVVDRTGHRSLLRPIKQGMGRLKLPVSDHLHRLEVVRRPGTSPFRRAVGVEVRRLIALGTVGE